MVHGIAWRGLARRLRRTPRRTKDDDVTAALLARHLRLRTHTEASQAALGFESSKGADGCAPGCALKKVDALATKLVSARALRARETYPANERSRTRRKSSSVRRLTVSQMLE
jgi:hypothetical protein